MANFHPEQFRLRDIVDFVAKKIGLNPADLPDGGVRAGRADTPIQGILIAWMATPAVLQAAAEKGLDTIVCHEEFLFDEIPQPAIYRWSSPPAEKPHETHDHPNQIRRQLAERYKLAIAQIHYGLDRLCICDDFMKQIGVTQVYAGDAYEKVYALPAPLPVSELAGITAGRLGLKYVRIAGDRNKMVSKVGNLWGGVGLSSNRYWMRRQIELGAEAIICGESDEAAEFFAQEFRGTVLIETSHVESENVGLRHFAAMLSEAFPALRVEFFELTRPNRIISF